VATAALAWWALWHEPRNVAVRRLTLTLPHWPRALAGMTVAVVSDLHTGAPHVDLDKVERIVARLNREEPDLVALLGDYAYPAHPLGHRVEPEQVAARLADLHAPLGRFAVLGNHDWDAHGASMPRALRDAGITVLENGAVRVDGGAAPFWIGGVADAMTRDPRLDATLGRVPPDEPVLLLSHDPDVFPHVPERVSLTLAGHTHGAQVDIPVIRDKVTPSQHGAHYTQGHQVEGGRHLFVSTGVGTSRLAIRFRARPEVVLLRLEAG
jgi:uncharacterized protein